MAGANGWNSPQTHEARLEGGVSLIRSGMAMFAPSVHRYTNYNFNASGGVHLHRCDRHVFGDNVEYNTGTGYGHVSGSARWIAEGTPLTGAEVHGWLRAIRAIAHGSVTFNTPDRNVSRSAVRATCTHTPQPYGGVVLLSRSAQAVQSGNVLTAPELRIRLADVSAETLGVRSTFIRVPNQY